MKKITVNVEALKKQYLVTSDYNDGFIMLVDRKDCLHSAIIDKVESVLIEELGLFDKKKLDVRMRVPQKPYIPEVDKKMDFQIEVKLSPQRRFRTRTG